MQTLSEVLRTVKRVHKKNFGSLVSRFFSQFPLNQGTVYMRITVATSWTVADAFFIGNDLHKRSCSYISS